MNGTNYTVFKHNSNVNVTATSEIYGNDSVITVVVPKAQTGYVTIIVNELNVNVTVEIVDGIAKYNVTNANTGRYHVNVTYLGDDLYLTSTNSTYFDISKAYLPTDVIAQNVTVKDNISFIITVPDDFTGLVNITVDGVKYSGNVTSLITMAKLFQGNKTATIVFYGDDNYNIKEVTANFTVTRSAPDINVTIDEVTYPDMPVAIVKVQDMANGTIIIEVDGKTFTNEIVNGSTIVKLDNLTGGNKEAIVKFITGDDYNFNNTVTSKFTINKSNSTIEISNSGRNVTARVTYGATGNVTFYINSKVYTVELKDGVAELDNVLISGNNAVVAIYEGDVNYTTSKTSASYVVGSKLTPAIDVVVSDVKEGDQPVFDITVHNYDVTGEGNITVTIANKSVTVELVDGKASIVWEDVLPKGDWIVKVNYTGDFKFNPDVTYVPFNVRHNTASDLQKLIDEAIRNNQTELNLTQDYLFNDDSQTVNIPASLKINGNGHTIDGNGVCGIFNITGDDVVLENIILTGGNATYGGAISWSGDNGLIDNVTFENNHAELGGAIYSSGDNLTIKQSEFTNNTAATGGAIYSEGDKLSVDNSSFTNNNATNGGAIYSTGNDASVKDSQFTNNSASENGGAIYSSGEYLSVEGSEFVNGSAANGAAIYSTGANANITASEFAGNNATNGGAIFSSGEDLSVSDSEFVDNSASENGGAIYSSGDDLSVTGSEFIDNNATNGGAVYSSGANANITASEFAGNNATNGGAIFSSGEDLSVSDSEFVDNSASENGGAIYSSGDDLSVTGSEFIDNNATNGGAVYSSGENLTVDNSGFSGNNATNGGAIYSTGDNSSVVDSEFEGNNATDGGAIYSSGKDLSVEGSEFKNNGAANKGGAIYSSGDNVNITDSEFMDNNATKGGAIFSSGDDLSVSDSELINNTAVTGGAIYIDGKNANITNSTFTNNTSNDNSNNIALGFNGSADVDELSKAKSDSNLISRVAEIGSVSVDVIGYGATIKVKLDSGVDVEGGIVQITVNGKTYEAKVSGSQAVIVLEDLPVGKYNIGVFYNGGSSYTNDHVNDSFDIRQFKLIGNKNLNIFYLQPSKYIVRAIYTDGEPVVGLNIIFKVNGISYFAKTNKTGHAFINIKLAPKKYTITASSSSVKVSNTIKVKHIIKAKKTTNVKKSVKMTIIKITVKGHNVKQVKKVKFTYKGKNKIKIKFGKEMKNQKVTVKFKGKTYKVKVDKKGKGTLKLTKKVAKKLKKGKKYVLKTTYKGPKLYKKVKLTIKFKGKKYKVKTNNKGIAKFKVTKKMVKKLKKGKKYSYTIVYKYDSLKRFIKIR